MQRTLIFSLLVLSAGVALIIGAYSALAGKGPVSGVAGAVVGTVQPDNGDILGGDEDGEDVNGEDGDGPQANGARHIAGLIEDAFGAEEGSAWALHEEGIGFGALFKLHALAAAMETSVDDLLATIPTDGDGGYEFGFGKLRKALTEDQQAALEAGPKNLGQIVSASHRPEHAGPDSEGATAARLEKAREKFAAHPSNGHGPPESVPVRGPR